MAPQIAKPTALVIPPTAVPAANVSTPVPQPTAVPAVVTSVRDTVRFVTAEEPTTIGAANANCGGNIQNTISDDIASDPGLLREERLRASADRVHNEFHFVPNFIVVSIYGMSAGLEWEPTYAPRVRINTMRFTK